MPADLPPLCETCGYSLQGSAANATCPECGTSVSESDASLRIGQPWDRRAGLTAWLETAAGMIVHPKRRARQHRFDGSVARPVAFTLIMATLCSIYVALLITLVLGFTSEIVWSLVTFGFIAMATTIETLGVTAFSRRHGWRMPWRHSLRIACYAGAAWPISTGLLTKFLLGMQLGIINPSWTLTFAQNVTVDFGPSLRLLLQVFGLALALLPFELLVWSSVRQCKHANVTRGGTTDEHEIEALRVT